MADTAGILEVARVASAAREWAAARDAFRGAAAHGPLDAEDLEALADACWWLGDVEEANRVLEQAHRRYLHDDRAEDAARAAVGLAVTHLLRGDDALGSGWAGRAMRLVEGLPEGLVHGYLLYLFEVEGLADAEPRRAVEGARRLLDLSRRIGDQNLLAVALNAQGRLLIRTGSTAEGLALLDESMAWVVAGELAPDWAGNLYCTTIAACHELADYGRMARWTQALEGWLAALPAAVLFGGICRVHRSQLLRLSGDWPAAEREALRVCEDLAGISVANVAAAWYETGEVRRLRGDLAGAVQAYRLAHEHGRDPQPGLALLRLAEGRVSDAAAAIRVALIATGGSLARAPLCAAQVEIAVASGDLDVARGAWEELAATAAMHGSAGLQAMAATAAGTVALAEGRHDEALPVLRDACRRWRELEAPHAAARSCVLLARTYEALGDADAVARELDAAGAVFDRLGATADAAVLARLRGRRTAHDGLSTREVEVLGLVATGRTNADIAAALFISTKTVARHLSNIFTKLGVATRTEAARYAFEHGLVPPEPAG
jgi:DNA-binding CsgD family transcriptional regulator